MSSPFIELKIEKNAHGIQINGYLDGDRKYSLSRCKDAVDWCVSMSTMPSGSLLHSILITNITIGCLTILKLYDPVPGFERNFKDVNELQYFIKHSEVFGPSRTDVR